MIVTSIPIVGLIMSIIWGFGNNDFEASFKNYYRLQLILQIIGLVLSIILIASGVFTTMGLMMTQM